MNYETAVVYLEQLPKVVLETGFDWPTFWSFSATALLFFLGTQLTIRNFKRTIESQERVAKDQQEVQRDNIASQELIAKQNSLKASRQNWINDLRDTCAGYIAEALNVNRLNVYWESARVRYFEYLEAKPEIAYQMHSDWTNSHVLAMKNLVSLKAKIELLLNPEEVDSKELMKAINDLHRECDRAGGPAKDLAQTVVEWCQNILKQEWEKAKSGE
ncbi:hypothetical protein KW869_09870 [Pseudomonas urmiensis]|uniref:Uncharacterized protein n=1 Tax=Pseudomonas urmiensis TaxID=2745493 RepID=A0ABW8NV50_9PSED